MSSEGRQRPIIRKPFAIALVVAVALGGAVGAVRYLRALPALAGEHHADLGEVWLDVDDESGALGGSAQHVYRLTNRTRRPIVVIEARSSCGCTVPTIDANTIEPGEQIEVTATVHLDRPGVRTAEVFLHLEGGDVETLTLEAVGRSRSPLRAEPHRLTLARDRAVTVRVIAEVKDDDDREPRLDVRPPEGVEAELANWRLWRAANPQRRTPAQWAGALRVSIVDERLLREDAAIEVVLNDEHVLRVPVMAPLARE